MHLTPLSLFMSVNMIKYPEYAPDHFQNLHNSSTVHNLLTGIPQISYKST